MEGVVVKVFQGDNEVASELISLPITAQEAKDALRDINAAWVGRLKESNNSSLILAGQCQLIPGAIYHLHLQEQRGGPTKNSAALVESLKQANKEFVQQVITSIGVVCDSLVMRIEGLSKEFADVADESEDQQDNIALDADTAWQAREDAYHEDLVELLRQPRMYQALGLSGPPDRIRHATLKERISNMRVLP